MQVVCSPEISAPTCRNIRCHNSEDNSKHLFSYSKGDHVGEKQTNNSQAQNIHLRYLTTKRKSFLYCSYSFLTQFDLANKCFPFSVQFLNNLQYPPLISHTVSTQLSTDGRTIIHTIVRVGIIRPFYNQISRLWF
jgi:hypothetical protein